MKCFALFVLFFSVLTISSKTFGYSSVDIEILKGLDDVYNLNFDQAENKFKKVQNSEPKDLKGYFYESLLYFYKALPARDDVMFEKYTELSEKVIKKAEDILDKDENNEDALYFKGLSHSYRSLLMLNLNKSLLKAASDGNEGYRLLTALIETNPRYYDAYMGLGLYKIALGFVPEKFKWLLSLIGIEGNIQEGLSMLNKSLENGKFTKTDSKVFLCLFSLKEKEIFDTKSITLARELTEDYPESPVFKILYSGFLLQSGNNTECIKNAGDALELNNNSFKNEITKSANALLGTVYFRENDFQNSIRYYEECMKYLNKEDRFNVHIFTLGVAYELSGNRNKAVEKYKLVREDFINERDGELDKLFYRYAKDKISKPLNELEINLVKGMNLRESMKLDEAVSFYNEILTGKNTGEYPDDDKIRLYYDIGLTYVYKKDPDNAVKSFERCLSLNPEEEIWLLPHSYFELGKILDKKGNKKKSEEMFEMIFTYNDYDFQSFLEMRLANYLYNKL